MKKTLIIAEAGVNHNGSLNLAKRLVDVAAEAGADIVKFQTFDADQLVTKTAIKAEYQVNNTRDSSSQYEMLKKLELSADMHVELIKYCRSKDIEFLSTPFDLDSIQYLDDLGIRIWKIPSGEITNYPYLQAIGKTRKPVIMSTGMSTLDEVREAIGVLKSEGLMDITLLHCNTQYPTPMCDVNLSAMHTLKDVFALPVGYSDHTLGIEVPIAAVAMGASVIEKHFTVDKMLEGPDHIASLSPDELKDMVNAIRNIEKAIGDGEKRPTASEGENIAVARKSIVARNKIYKGEVFSNDNITTKRPGNGISPMRWNEVVGKVATRDFEVDELIEI